MELQKKYKGRYLLQVWSNGGSLVYSRILQQPVHLWNLIGQHFVFVLSQKEPLINQYRQQTQIYIVKLYQDINVLPRVALIHSRYDFNFYQQDDDVKVDKTQLDQFLAFTEDHLVVAKSNSVQYVKIHNKYFQESKGDIDPPPYYLPGNTDDKGKLHQGPPINEVNFIKGVKILMITEITGGVPCLITEKIPTNQVQFIRISTIAVGRKIMLNLQELSDEQVDNSDDIYDPIIRIVSSIFLDGSSDEYKHCGLIIHQSGTLDFIWNFRIVNTQICQDKLKDDFCDDINFDFDYVYFNQVEFSGAQELMTKINNRASSEYGLLTQAMNALSEAESDTIMEKLCSSVIIKHQLYRTCCQWKERISPVTAKVFGKGNDEIRNKQCMFIHQRVASFVCLYPWFSNMSTHFAICHSKFLSIFEINSQQWEHVAFDDNVKSGFRKQDPSTQDYLAGIILTTGRLHFVNMISGAIVDGSGQKLNLGGEVVNIAKDKNLQRFILFLVRKGINIKQRFQASVLNANKSVFKKTIAQAQQANHLELYIYTDRLLKIDLPVRVHNDSTLYIIEQSNDPNSAYITIDSALEGTSNFFKIVNLTTKPKLLKVDTLIKRPINVERNPWQNNLVGFMNQSGLGGSSVYVTRSDMTVIKSCSKNGKNGPTEIGYKNFTQRNIQAVLSLDSWMYTLQNQCKDDNSKGEEDSADDKLHPGRFYDNLGRPKAHDETHNHDYNSPVLYCKIAQRQKSKAMFNGKEKEAPGLYAYDLHRLASTQTLTTYKLKDAIVGVNQHIDFCKASYRISFLKSFDNIEMVPCPHRNTINFLGMQSKDNYLIWRELKGVFTALDTGGKLHAWVIGTGKVTKPLVTVGAILLDGYELYSCNSKDDTYKHNWQQHPEVSISLLKSTKELQHYEKEQHSIIAENQAANLIGFGESMKPQVFMFKLITMSDEIVKEEFTFNFDFHSAGEMDEGTNGEFKEPLQIITVSRDLSKLMEVFTDSRCRIYEKKQQVGKKRINWVMIYQIKKYPTPLQGESFANFLFSPNLNYYIDILIAKSIFCVKQCATNKVLIEIPKGLYSFKADQRPERSVQCLASRIRFIGENTIRIINKYGIDSVLELDYVTAEVKVKSVCKIDHFDEKNSADKHAMIDQVYIHSEHVLERLLRANQRFKCVMVHMKDEFKLQYGRTNDWIDNDQELKEQYKDKLHQQLQTVDYSQPWDDANSQFVAEMTFSILDWQIMGRLTNSELPLNVKNINKRRILQLCFNVFPGVKTVLHKFIEARVTLEELNTLFNAVHSQKLQETSDIQCIIPILEDKNGDTALDIALKKGQEQANLANQLLLGIKDYPYLSMGKTMNTGVNLAFKHECPILGTFLNSRLVVSRHLHSGSLARKALKIRMVQRTGEDEPDDYYGTMQASPWQDKERLKEEMFNPQGFDRAITLKYFDIPSLHTFDDEGCEFMMMLANTEDIQLFLEQSVQYIIMHKWKKVKNFIIYLEFVPSIALLSVHSFWNFRVRPTREDHVGLNQFFVFVQFILTGYFLMFEVMQLMALKYLYWQEWVKNLTDLIPLFNISIMGFISLNSVRTTSVTIENDPTYDVNRHNFTVWFEIAAIIMLWLNLFYYLRIWTSTNYLARMIKQVLIDMQAFLLITVIVHCAFGQCFILVSLNSPEQFQDGTDFWKGFLFNWQSAIGDFTYSQWDDENNSQRYLHWAVLITSLIVSNIVLTNLLISIVGETYNTVREHKIEYQFQERAHAISSIQRIWLFRFLVLRGYLRNKYNADDDQFLLVVQENRETHTEAEEMSGNGIEHQTLDKMLDNVKESQQAVLQSIELEYENQMNLNNIKSMTKKSGLTNMKTRYSSAFKDTLPYKNELAQATSQQALTERKPPMVKRKVPLTEKKDPAQPMYSVRASHAKLSDIDLQLSEDSDLQREL